MKTKEKTNKLELLAQKQVASFDECTALLNLGFSYPTFFFWITTKSNPKWHLATAWDGILEDKEEMDEMISAPSSAELIELLPVLISAQHEGENRQWELFCGKDEDGCFCGYFNASIGKSGKFLYQKYGKNEADARAKMLQIYLIENFKD